MFPAESPIRSLSNSRDEDEEQAMSKLRLLVKKPGRANPLYACDS